MRDVPDVQMKMLTLAQEEELIQIIKNPKLANLSEGKIFKNYTIICVFFNILLEFCIFVAMFVIFKKS